MSGEAGARAPRFAVVARGHFVNAHFEALVEALEGSSAYDFYVATNDERGPVIVGDHKRLPYTTRDIRPLGYETDEEEFFGHMCADALYEHFARVLPQYDYFVHVEWDVHFSESPRVFMERLVGAVAAQGDDPISVAGTQILHHTARWWDHYDRTKRLFPDVWSVFYPFTVFSTEAIHLLHELRLEMEPRDMPARQRVHCEGFTASALKQLGRRVVDLNALIPNAYDPRTFQPSPGMMAGTDAVQRSPVLTMHPVYAPEDHLGAHLKLAQREGHLHQFRASLQGADLPISAEQRQRFTAAAVAAQPSPPPLSPALEGAPLQSVSVVMLPRCPERSDDYVNGDINAWLRTPEGGAVKPSDGCWLEPVGSRPLASHAIDWLRAAGARGVTLLATPSEAEKWRTLSPRETAEVDVLVRGDRSHEAVSLRDRLFASRVLLVYADNLADLQFNELLRSHFEAGRPATLAAARPSQWIRTLEGQKQKWDCVTTGFPVWGALNAGFILLDPEIAPAALDAAEQDLLERAFIPKLRSQEQVNYFDHRGFWQSGETPIRLSVLRTLWNEGAAPWSVSPNRAG